MPDPRDCLKTRPERVVLLAHGESFYSYIEDVINLVGKPLWDEVWIVNFLSQAVRHDKLFFMDDLRKLPEEYPYIDKILKTHNRPIITSTPYSEYPNSVAFPIKQVIDVLRDDLFENTCCYAMGYALAIGVKELWCYGCDFYYPDKIIAEKGGQNAAYFIGLARGFGCTVKLPRETTLLSMNRIKVIGDGDYTRPLYGYAEQPDLRKSEFVLSKDDTKLRSVKHG